MRANAPALARWEAAGGVFMIVVGSALHFAFDLSGQWRPAALFAAVNESVWEHLKLAFWPGVLWALAPSPAARPPARPSLWERLSVRGYSLLLTAGLIVAIFASYTAILGDNLLVLDIGTFVLAVLAGQALAATLVTRNASRRPAVRQTGFWLLLAQLVAFALFTFYPPDHWIFIESSTGLRGVPPA